MARWVHLAPRMEYQPLHDRVLVRIDPVNSDEQTTAGGLIMVRSSEVNQHPLREAIVLAVGAGEILYNGDIRPLSVEPGQRVLVHFNEVLPLRPTFDPLEPVEGVISERQILCKID